MNSVINFDMFTRMYYFVVKGSWSELPDGDPGGVTSSGVDIY